MADHDYVERLASGADVTVVNLPQLALVEDRYFTLIPLFLVKSEGVNRGCPDLPWRRSRR